MVGKKEEDRSKDKGRSVALMCFGFELDREMKLVVRTSGGGSLSYPVVFTDLERLGSRGFIAIVESRGAPRSVAELVERTARRRKRLYSEE